MIGLIEIAVTRKRPEREEFRIAVITQIEHAREPRRSELRFAPQSIGFLTAQQIINPFDDRRVLPLSGGHESEQCPGGLRGGAWCRLMAVIVELVAIARLAPSAVGVLY